MTASSGKSVDLVAEAELRRLVRAGQFPHLLHLTALHVAGFQPLIAPTPARRAQAPHAASLALPRAPRDPDWSCHPCAATRAPRSEALPSAASA